MRSRPFSPFRSQLMKSQTSSPSGTRPASSVRMWGGLRTNWQHPCFQCNCTYLASHLRGSLRGSGLIEQSAAEWKEERSQAEQIFGPLHQQQNFSPPPPPPSLTRPLTWDTFNQSALIAPLPRPTNARRSFLFIEISVIIISQRYSHQPSLMGQIHRFKSVME